MSTLKHTYLHRTILALITLALLSLPFAHRVGAAPVTAEMAQFLALGGNLTDICGDTQGHSAGGCESCNIVASMLMPPAVHAQHPMFVPTLLTNDFGKANTTPVHATRNTHPVRAPPLS